MKSKEIIYFNIHKIKTNQKFAWGIVIFQNIYIDLFYTILNLGQITTVFYYNLCFKLTNSESV